MKTKKVNNKKTVTKTKKKKNYFEVIFVSVSILMFVLLIFSIYFLRNSLYIARDQVALEFLSDYEKGLIVDGNDPFVAISGSVGLDKEYLKPVDNNSDPSIGPRDASIKIFYFSDFACPFCLEQEEVIKKVYDKFSQDVRIIWKYYPDINSLESFSYQAARAVRCADEQGEFWDYNKMLYENEESFPTLKNQLFLNLANNLKLNLEKFSECLAGPEVDYAIFDNVVEAENLGVLGIPYIYINDLDMIGGLSERDLERIIEVEMEKKN